MRVVVARRLLVAAVVVAMGGARRAAAQGTPTPPDVDAICFGFAFGAWSPPLDWRAAGHGDRPDSTRLVHAPAGRDWAAEAVTPGDTALMLYPAWWPVGVVVQLPARRMVDGDTVTGRASALVADGRMRPPTATVRAWRVPCGGASRPPQPDDSASRAPRPVPLAPRPAREVTPRPTG